MFFVTGKEFENAIKDTLLRVYRGVTKADEATDLYKGTDFFYKGEAFDVTLSQKKDHICKKYEIKPGAAWVYLRYANG